MTDFFKNIGSLLRIHCVVLVIMSCMRVLTLCIVPYIIPEQITISDVIRALAIGVWFDNVVVCYILIIPILLCILFTLINYENIIIEKCIVYVIGFLFSVTFIISIANIPYFCYFFENINASIYQWFLYLPTTLSMLLTEKSYWLFIFLMVAFVFCWWKWIKRICFLRKTRLNLRSKQKLEVLCLGLLLIGAYGFGIRGRLGYNPIKISQAYFCQDPFLNQLGISPTFNMLVTTLDLTRKENKILQLMDSKDAYAEVRKILEMEDGCIEKNSSELTRIVKGCTSVHTRKNIVIILMESMSAELLNKGDTPFLDSLCRKSTYYCNTYSSGNHTNHGIYSTLYSFPAIMFRNMLKGSIVPHIDGLPKLFQQRGYSTIFYMSHESQYDNMNAFLRTNGFSFIRSQEDYPRSEIVNSFGVSDDFLFNYSLKELTALSKKNVPFFSVILTISNHPPYVLPENYVDNNIPLERQIVRYADGCLRKFFNHAYKEDWYANTIFILLGDHGKLLKDKECELPRSFNHIPFIIHGADIPIEKNTAFALQMDVAPTLLGLMGWDYIQNNFGVDLNKITRKYAFYTGDKYIAIRSKEYVYLYRPNDKTEYAYAVEDGNLKKIITRDKEIQQMKRYLFAMIQCAESLR